MLMCIYFCWRLYKILTFFKYYFEKTMFIGFLYWYLSLEEMFVKIRLAIKITNYYEYDNGRKTMLTIKCS